MYVNESFGSRFRRPGGSASAICSEIVPKDGVWTTLLGSPIPLMTGVCVTGFVWASAARADQPARTKTENAAKRLAYPMVTSLFLANRMSRSSEESHRLNEGINGK